jgi:DNA repair exonuclease SbcCD ATPase subunit
MASIKSLRFKNFKSTGGKWEEFSFPKSLNLINGDVGVGKTTVYSAITYVLYNKNTDFKGNSKSTLPVNRLINDVNKKELMVEIELDNGYTIKRGQKPDVFQILKDNENLANKSVTVDQSYLENTILEGMSFDIFLSTVYLSAKPGSVPFIHMTLGQRKEYIEKILDLRRLHYYNENLKKYIAENKLEKASLDKEQILIDETITNEEFNIITQMEKQREDEQKLKDFQNNHSIRLKEQEELLNKAKISLSAKKEQLANFKVPDEDLKSFRDEIQELEKYIEQVKVEDTTTDKITSIKENIKKNTKSISGLKFENNMLETDIGLLSADFKDEDDLVWNTLCKDIPELEAKIKKLQDINTQKSAENNAYLKSKENYHFCGECPTLTKIIGSYSIDEYNVFKNKMQETISNFSAELDNKIERKKQIENIKQKNVLLKEKINDFKNKLEKNNDNIKYLNENNSNLNSNIKNIIDNIEKEKELKISTTNNKIESIKKSIVNSVKEKKTELESNIKSDENTIIFIEDKIDMIKNENEPTIREVNENYLLELKEKKDTVQKRLDEEYNKSVDLDELKKEINSPEHKIKAIKKYIPVFESKLNEILDIFMEDDVFDLRAKLSEAFELSFYKNGKEISVFTLSSGQVACCSLACTFAFLYLLEVKHQSRFNHLLIDELLDLNIGTRIMKVLNYLKTISHNKNISVISHNKTLDTEMFDTVTYVSKDNLFSKYTIA